MKYDQIKQLTRELRHNATLYEHKLWWHLRRKQLDGRKFLRQHAIIYESIEDEHFFYVPDFYCFKENLAVDLDGKIHLYSKQRDKNRDEILKVTRLGPKVFEQAAGFLRIPDALNPLDNSGVHPESYKVVKKIAKDLKGEVKDLIRNEELISKIDFKNYVTAEVGLPTLTDIKNELLKPGRDPRKPIKIFEFADGIFNITDLQVGMVLPGIVNNITKFGAFVDVGIKESGLIHISEMADRFISDPNEIVKLHQHIKVRVKDLDIPRKRIQLSLKGVEQE